MFASFSNQTINKTGIGLGLFTSKKLSQGLSYEGDEGLTVVSTIGKGSTFRFLLENKAEEYSGSSS